MTETPRIDRADRLIRATPEAIHAAFLDLAALVRWLPPAGMTGEILAWDPRPGGAFQIAPHYEEPGVTGKTSARTDIAQGRFLEVTPRRIVQRIAFDSADPAFAGAMTMTWSFDPVPGGTRVSIACADVPPGIAEADHAAGLAASLANLAAFVEPENPR